MAAPVGEGDFGSNHEPPIIALADAGESKPPLCPAEPRGWRPAVGEGEPSTRGSALFVRRFGPGGSPKPASKRVGDQKEGGREDTGEIAKHGPKAGGYDNSPRIGQGYNRRKRLDERHGRLGKRDGQESQYQTDQCRGGSRNPMEYDLREGNKGEKSQDTTGDHGRRVEGPQGGDE